MKSYRWFALKMLLLLSAIVAPLIHPSLAFACLPGGRWPYSVSERTEAAEFVIEGLVWEIGSPTADDLANGNTYSGELGAASLTNGPGIIKATILVSRYLKGNGPNIIEIQGFGMGGGDCLSLVMPGEQYLFFASGDAKQVLTANYLGVYSATEEISPKNVSQAVQTSGQTPSPKLAWVAKLRPISSLPHIWLLAICVNGLFPLLAGSTAYYFGQPGKNSPKQIWLQLTKGIAIFLIVIALYRYSSMMSLLEAVVKVVISLVAALWLVFRSLLNRRQALLHST